VEALWSDGRDGGLAPLLSKLRRLVELDGLRPVADWIDVEAAAAAVAELVAAGLARKRAAELVGLLSGVSRNELYRRTL
jgi:hypothetical protein